MENINLVLIYSFSAIPQKYTTDCLGAAPVIHPDLSDGVISSDAQMA